MKSKGISKEAKKTAVDVFLRVAQAEAGSNADAADAVRIMRRLLDAGRVSYDDMFVTLAEVLA